MIRRSTLVLLGIFLVLVVAAVLWQRSRDQQAEQSTPTPEASTLFNTAGRTIIGLRISAANGGLVNVKKDADNVWQLVNLPAESADDSRIESAIMEIEGMRVLSQIGSPPDLAVIELEPPMYRVTVTYEGGLEEVVLFGAQTPTQSGYYALQNNRQVVVVSSLNVENLLELINNPPIFRTPTPSPSPDLTTPEIAETPQP